MKEEYFVTFGDDPRNRKAVKTKVPEGFFSNSCEKGLVWALKLDYEDITKTLVSMALTAANSANILLVFKSDDYHKIDKIKWESAIALEKFSGEYTGEFKCLGYVDDEIDDKYAEYVVSYESMKPVLAIPSFFVANPDESNVNIFIQLLNGGNASSTDNNIEQAVKETFANSLKANKEILKQASFDLVGSPGNSSGEYAINSGIVITLFTMLYASIILNPIINMLRKTNGIESPIPLYFRMGDISIKNAQKLFNLLNSAVMSYSSGIIDYDAYGNIYDSIYQLLDYKEPWMFEAVLSGIGRNDPCPCGSGKKWKKCHGMQL